MSNRVLGTAIVIAAAVSLMGTRGIAVLLPLLCLLVLQFAISERSSPHRYLRLVPVTASFGILLAYALASTSWGPAPGDAIPHVLTAMLMLTSAHIIASWIGQQDEPRIRHLGFWLVIAFSISLFWLTFEILTEQATKRWIINAFEFLKPFDANKHYSFDKHGEVWLASSDLNRNIASVNLLLWPVLMCAAILWSGPWRTLILGAILAAAAVATFASDHETSKLALISSLAVFLLARQSTPFAKAAVGTGWLIAVIGVVPIALYAYSSLNLHNAEWLQTSGRDRIVIWADIGKRTLEAPVLGAGARTTYKLHALGERSLTQSETGRQVTIGRHPHNVFLQTWFELGAVGAALLAVAGGVVLLRLKRVPSFAKPFALAAVWAVALELGFCWDIWQRWFFALLAFSAVILALTLRFAALRTPPALKPASA